ncbi:fumarylpyruvate hydrolase [Azospirillaceae bacterium]
MGFVIPSPRPIFVAVSGVSDLFPVRRIFCVGRNYAAHAREMGADPNREPPFFFTKPADAIVPNDGIVPYPPATKDLQHEVELVVALGHGGRNIPTTNALENVFGYSVGLDMTRRDLQAAAKKVGHPWDMAKGFDHSAPCAALQPVSAIGHPKSGAITLAVNGALRQKGDLADMIWSVAETIASLSQLVALEPGDLIYTGTPEGVGPVVPGDRLEGCVEGVGVINITIGN